jgi:hypothetical protein
MTNHKNIIQSLLDSYPNKNYLKIGVASGKNFAAINARYKVGVDPIPPRELVEKSVNENCIYHSKTSDDFFAAADKNGIKYDVIFADGLHEYEQTYRDIVNALDHLAPNGVIVVHDCKPESEIMALPPRMYSIVDRELKKKDNFSWTGDTWKAIVDLRSFHNDLFVFTLDCDWGCAVVTRGEPESMLGFSKSDIKAMEYSDLKKNVGGMLNLKHPTYFRIFMEKYRGVKSNYMLYVENIEEWKAASEKDYYIEEPIEVQTVENGIILPLKWDPPQGRSGGVCDADGNFITGHKRHMQKGASGNIDHAYPIPDETQHSTETVIYGGLYDGHYGHFIMETLSRMWYFIENPNNEYKVVFIWGGSLDCLEFLLMLGLREENIILLNKPTRFKKIIIPDHSFYLGNGYKDKAMAVYNVIRDSVIPAKFDKVYLTKSKLKSRHLINEEYFENYYREQGFEIIAPEELSIREQVAVMAGASEVVTTIGTTQHQILFSRDGIKTTILTRGNQPEASLCWINQARAVECTLIDVTLDLLPTFRTLGCQIVYPTEYFKYYVNDYNGEHNIPCRSLRDMALDYIEYWASSLAGEPEHFMIRYQNVAFADVIIGLNNLFGNELDESARKRLKETLPSISSVAAKKEK